MAKKSVGDLSEADLKGKVVFVRADLNVPLDKKTLEITDDTRIRAAIPTLEYLVAKGARVMLTSHLVRRPAPAEQGYPPGAAGHKLNTASAVALSARNHVLARRAARMALLRTSSASPRSSSACSRCEQGRALSRRRSHGLRCGPPACSRLRSYFCIALHVASTKPIPALSACA